MNTLVSITQAQAPASSRARLASGSTLSSNFADGIRDSFPILSIKGKVFQLRVGGQSQAILDPQTNQPVQSLDLLLVNASRQLSKSYYIKGFSEGDINPPDCWSLDSIRPDPSVINKVNPTCPNCPMNAFGSRMTDNGKAAKACQDARRVAVLMPHQLGDPAATVMMLRIPQSSLKNLKNHVQLLERHGFLPNACVSRLSFDYTEAFPKLNFNFGRPLSDQEFLDAEELANSALVSSMLVAPDFDNAASVAPEQTGQMHGFAPQAAPVIQPIPEAAPQAQPQQAAPVIQPVQEQAAPVHEVHSTVIELPDGKLFDTATGEYIERPQPAVQMAELDPATIKLPEGNYFNTVTREYVTGPEKGAPIATPPQPVTRERKKVAAKPKVEVKPDTTPAPAPVVAKADDKPVIEAKVANGVDDSEDVKPVVTGAVPELDAILKKLVVPSVQ